MAVVVCLGWLVIGFIYVLQEFMLRRYDLKSENNFRARRIHTQFQLFRRLLITFIIVITVGGLLWTFNDPRIWHYGSGLLASAGIAFSHSCHRREIHRIQLFSQDFRLLSPSRFASMMLS